MATINLTEEQLPAVNEWEEGDRKKVSFIVEKTTPTKEGEAEFQIKRASGRDVTEEEEMEVEEDGESLPSFAQAAEEAAEETGRQDVLEPSQGEGAETQSPERRTV